MRWSVVAAAALILIAPGALAQTQAAQRVEVVEALAAALERDYVYPETGAVYARSLREKAAAGSYASGDDTAFAEQVGADLNAVKADRHLRLLAPAPQPGAGGPRMVRGPGPDRPKAMEASMRLTPDIAYVRFNMFPGDAQSAADIETFIAANAGVKTLIIDARGHRGGSPADIDLLFADLFSEQTDLVQMEFRKAVAEQNPWMMQGGPTFRTLPSAPEMLLQQHVAVPSANPRLKDTKLYVLQSGVSGSAAEHLLFAVKLSKRGTLVGEPSAGAGHFGFGLELPAGFSTFIPVGRTFDPATGKDWEGVGVAPDLPAASADALVVALKDAGVAAEQAEALNATLSYTPPKPRQRPPG
jgi:hypothetical protein